MGTSHINHITWDEFWNNEQDNPNGQLVFKYLGKTYIAEHDRNKWYIAEFNDETGEYINFLVEAVQSSFDTGKKHDDIHWQEYVNKYLTVLTAPVFEGKSFKDIIQDIELED